ncbi:MAG: hypothetical protein IRY84_11545 [Thermobispora bispora]|nr:hypothetical protein [Thermobispora bispora]
MDQLVAPKPPPLSLTQAAVRALERLQDDLAARYRIRPGRITANNGIAVLDLGDFQVWCHRGTSFTWSDGVDERNRAVLAKEPTSNLAEAAKRVAIRYRQVHGYQPAPARRAG